MAIDKSIIDEQIKALDQFDISFAKKEITYLPEVIVQGEIIMGLTRGFLGGDSYLFAITSRRLLLLHKGMICGLKQIEIPIDQISTISHTIGLMSGKLQIMTISAVMIIEQINKKEVARIAQIISDVVQTSQNKRTSSDTDGVDVLSRLERLAALKEKGIITEDEFRVQKENILTR